MEYRIFDIWRYFIVVLLEYGFYFSFKSFISKIRVVLGGIVFSVKEIIDDVIWLMYNVKSFIGLNVF